MEISDSENSDNEPMTPPELSKETEEPVEVDPGQSIIPEYSREKYFRVYEVFKEWQQAHDHEEVTEPVMMDYFEELNKTKKPSTLWSQYSMLKSTLNIKENLDISQFKKLRAYLKKQGTGFRNVRSKVLTNVNISDFLLKASDYEFLSEKVIMIFGIVGACRKSEIVDLTMSDILDTGTNLVVTIQATPRRQMRKFTIDGDLYTTVKKYMNLRPKQAKINRLFLNYQKGKCTQQPIGINKIGGIPKRIAAFLELPDADKYTGHCFRRTSAELLAQSGANVVNVIGGWKATGNKTPGKSDNPLQIYNQMEASTILKTCLTDAQQPQQQQTHIIINQVPINQQAGTQQFQVNQGQIITTQGQLITNAGQLINNPGQLINNSGQLINNQVQFVNSSGQSINNTGQLLNNNQSNVSQQINRVQLNTQQTNTRVQSGNQLVNRVSITRNSSPLQVNRVQINKQVNVVNTSKISGDNQESVKTLNLDGFKFVVVEIDRRVEVVQKGWTPPEGAEYVKPHAIFDSYKSASDYAETINVKKTPRVTEVPPNLEVISIDADSSNCPETSTPEVKKIIKPVISNAKSNKVINNKLELPTSPVPTSTATTSPGSVNSKRIIGTLVNKNASQGIRVSPGGGVNKVIKTKRFIGALVNKNFTKNPPLATGSQSHTQKVTSVNNVKNLDSRNIKSGNVIIVVEKVENSSNVITGDVTQNSNPSMEVDTKDPTLTSNLSDTNTLEEPIIKEDVEIKEEFINEEFIDEEELMVVDPLAI